MKDKPSIIEIKPPAQLGKSKERFDIFLAGSIENGKAEKWQDAFVEEFKKIKNLKRTVGIFNPRRDDWDPTWKEGSKELEEQIEWEVERLEQSDLIVMYLQPGTISPVSLYELGLFCKDVYALRKRMIVLCPSGFHRKTNVDVYCSYFDITVAKDMKDLYKKAKKELEDYDPNMDDKMAKLGKQLSEINENLKIKELKKELKESRKDYNKAMEISFQTSDDNNKLKKEIEKLKGEKKKIYLRSQKQVTEIQTLKASLEEKTTETKTKKKK